MSSFQTDYQEYQSKLALSIKNHERIIAQLRTFLILRKDIQQHIFNDLFDHYFKTQNLLNEIIDKDINIDSITKYNSGLSKLVPDDDEIDEDDYYPDDDDDTNNTIVTK